MNRQFLKSSKVKNKLRKGGTCFGTMLRVLKSPQSFALCASVEWDFVILDTEHNDFDLESLGTFSVLAKYEDLSMFVRVPDKLYHQLAQILDIGAEGIVLPRVNTSEEVRQIIQSTKYAPWGKRGVSISNTVTRFRDFEQKEYTKWANDELLNIIQIESEEGVNNIRELVSIKGVDAVMIGPADLSQDMGISGEITHAKAEEAYMEVIEACNEYGVAPGIHFADMDLVQKWVKKGMRFITYSYDSKFIKDGFNNAISKLRGFTN